MTTNAASFGKLIPTTMESRLPYFGSIKSRQVELEDGELQEGVMFPDQHAELQSTCFMAPNGPSGAQRSKHLGVSKLAPTTSKVYE